MKQPLAVRTGAKNLIADRSSNKGSGFRHAALATLAATIVSSGTTSAVEYDLTPSGNTSFNVAGAFGGTAVFSDYFTQPAGTGVFEPFLTLDANGQTSTGLRTIEQAYNTDGFTAMYLDQLRPNWNTRLTLGNLAQVNRSGVLYYAFLLDSNEPGADKSLLSVDNVRIYTSAGDNTAAVGNNLSNLDALGTLRWALNDPTKNANGTFNIDNWIKLDSAQENVEAGANVSNGGSGKSDMIAYIPVSAFVGALPTDYLWFYNLNGVHYSADKDLAAQSGYEEWRAVVNTPPGNVPDGGTTLVLLAGGLSSLAMLRRKLGKS